MFEKSHQKTFSSSGWAFGEPNIGKDIRESDSSVPDFKQIDNERESLMKEILSHMREGPNSKAVQKLIARHYQSLKVFHEPSIILYRGLANLYVEDGKFATYFEKFHNPDLPRFMHDAMIIFCQTREVRV